MVVEQFGKPQGLLGRVVAVVLRSRASNRKRNLRALALLDEHGPQRLHDSLPAYLR